MFVNFIFLYQRAINALRKKNIKVFEWALDEIQDSDGNKSEIQSTIFEKVLMTPNSSEFIEACIKKGADVDRVRCFEAASDCRSILLTFDQGLRPVKIFANLIFSSAWQNARGHGRFFNVILPGRNFVFCGRPQALLSKV